MSQSRFSAWQKATALVPLALLSGAWTTTLAVSSTASATPPQAATLPDGTQLPDEPIEAPASVSQPGSIAPGVPAGAADSVVRSASANGIPAAALAAYQRAEQVINTADKSCNISWELVAAIGRVESDHGRYGGNVLGDDGRSRPGIYGIPLDGSNGTAEIRDTDAGQLDDDKVFDRAVGPMQFIPGTWEVVGVDGDGDGKRDPQDIDDAALASAVYLCSGDEDLATDAGRRSAVYRYNHSREYVDLVLSIMAAYLDGDFSSVPNGVGTAPVFSPSGDDAVFTPATAGLGRGPDARRERQREQAERREAGGGGTGGGTPSNDPSDGTGGTGGDDETPVVTDPGDEPTEDPVRKVRDGVEETTRKVTEPVEDVTDPLDDATGGAVGGTLTYAEAKAQCLAEGVLTLNLDDCIDDLLG